MQFCRYKRGWSAVGIHASLTSPSKMRLLLAVAFLLWAVADAHHIPEHNLKGPIFKVGWTHVYEGTVNMTARIPGLSSQITMFVLKAECSIYAVSETEYILKVENVKVSEGENDGYIGKPLRLKAIPRLESDLARPIKFTLVDGKVTSYTLNPSESIESKKIKRSLLRSIQIDIRDNELEEIFTKSIEHKEMLPYIYNVTKSSPVGDYVSQYMIDVSPYPDFPYETSVFNISRSNNYENLTYGLWHRHHNFEKQGCPEVCKQEWQESTMDENLYTPGCPCGYEPFQTPITATEVRHWHLRLLEGQMIPEIFQTNEWHTVSMYDQDMTIYIGSYCRMKSMSRKRIEEPKSQTTYTNLDEFIVELNEEELSDIAKKVSYLSNEKCGEKQPSEVIRSVVKMLDEVTKTIVEGDLESTHSQMVGEKVVLIQKALTLLKREHLEKIYQQITQLSSLRQASEPEKIKRQLWLQILPLVGTPECVEYIKFLIKRNEVAAWEAKQMLEALPQNIMYPCEKTITELRELLELPQVTRYHVVHSAAHLCVARVIQKLCIAKNLSEPIENLKQSMESTDRRWFNECPESLVSRFVEEISRKLKRTDKMQEKVVYIETLAHMGVSDVLPVLTPYIYGIADDIQRYADGDIDFLKTVTLYSLHNLVSVYPESIQRMVTPIYFNKTEVPRVRIAAFTVMLRCEPSFDILQHVAFDSWMEPSQEVGSFVYSYFNSIRNASHPCSELVSTHVERIMPLMKTYEIGYHHAKNIFRDYYDDLRNFGLKEYFSFVPSNESFIPSNIYGGIDYSLGSFHDAIRFALNIQGIDLSDLLKNIDLGVLGYKLPKTIPRTRQREIFSQLNFVQRLPQEMRFTLYKKMFYSTSYYYFDAKTIVRDIEPLMEYLKLIFTQSRSQVAGHLVKLYIPSSYRTMTLARILAFPLEFEWKNPLIFALKVETKEEPRLENIHLYIRPSVYAATLYSHHFKNLIDCKAYGIYFEQKFTASYPFEVKIAVKSLTEIEVTYKPKDLPKKLIRYTSEAGTYIGEEKLERMPCHEDREPITTVPVPFKKEMMFSVLGLPPVHVEMHTEDIEFGKWDHPRDWEEVMHRTMLLMGNAGWRRTSLNYTLLTAPRVWPVDNEITFKFNYSTIDRVPNQPRMQNEWHQQSADIVESVPSQEQPNFETESPEMMSWSKNDDKKSTENAKRLFNKLAYQLPHVEHAFEVYMESKKVHNKGHLRIEYNHTYDKMVQAFTVHAHCEGAYTRSPLWLKFMHIINFNNLPNEFEYHPRKYGKQECFMYHCICFSNKDCLNEPDVVTNAKCSYNPVENQIGRELLDSSPEYFLPENHEECLRDVREGRPLSVPCMRVVQEQAIYNKLELYTTWKKDIPAIIRNITNKIDVAIKHLYYHHADINMVDVNNEPNTLHMRMEYIDKMTDEPVLDIYMHKPRENVHYHKIRSPLVSPLSSIYEMPETVAHRITNNTLFPTCALMEKYVRTYDMMTYEMPEDKCTYVLSAHCHEDMKFAVLAKLISATTKEIHMFIGTHKLILTPGSSDSYKVTFDGREYTVNHNKPVYFDREARIHCFTRRLSDEFSLKKGILVVHADTYGIKGYYDGKNFKLQVHPTYKGELCGLCSEYDGEYTREYRSVDRCLYSDSMDFARSCIVDADRCHVNKEPKYPVMCPSEENTHSGTWEPTTEDYHHEGNEPTKRRNLIRNRNDFICFSTRPVPVCEESTMPVETESMELDFHCLPKRDATARKLIVEAKRRVLGELATKSVDFTETVNVAKKC